MASAAQPSVSSGLLVSARLNISAQPAADRSTDTSLCGFFGLMNRLFADIDRQSESSVETVGAPATTPGGPSETKSVAPTAVSPRRAAAMAAPSPNTYPATLLMPASHLAPGTPLADHPDAAARTPVRRDVPATVTAADHTPAAAPPAPIAGIDVTAETASLSPSEPDQPLTLAHASTSPRTAKRVEGAAKDGRDLCTKTAAGSFAAAAFTIALPEPVSASASSPHASRDVNSSSPDAADASAEVKGFPVVEAIGDKSPFAPTPQILPAADATAAPAVPFDHTLPAPHGIPEALRISSLSDVGTRTPPFELAFSLRLTPLPAVDATFSPAPGGAVRPEAPAAGVAFPRPQMPPIVPGAPAAEAPSSTVPAERSAPIPHISSRQPRPTDTDFAAVSVPTTEHAAALHVAGVVPAPEQEIEPETTRSAPEPAPAATVESLSHDALKPPAAIRSLEFQLDSNQGRVAIRLADRAGDVKVDVRTADNRLASALRGELPELAARIEQSGYRAEMWHPSASSDPERGRPVESAAWAGDFQNSSHGGHGNGQEQEQRGWTEPKQASARKNSGKDFQWLFTSIR